MNKKELAHKIPLEFERSVFMEHLKTFLCMSGKANVNQQEDSFFYFVNK